MWKWLYIGVAPVLNCWILATNHSNARTDGSDDRWSTFQRENILLEIRDSYVIVLRCIETVRDAPPLWAPANDPGNNTTRRSLPSANRCRSPSARWEQVRNRLKVWTSIAGWPRWWYVRGDLRAKLVSSCENIVIATGVPRKGFVCQVARVWVMMLCEVLNITDISEENAFLFMISTTSPEGAISQKAALIMHWSLL